MTWIKTACPLDCYDTCGMLARVDDGKIVEVKGDPDHPITKGRLCVRGHNVVKRHSHPERILTPLKRTATGWEAISWEKAYYEIAERMKQAIDLHGPLSIMHSYDYGSSGLTKSLIDRFFYALDGFTETVGSLCWDAGLEAQTLDFGEARSHSPDDMAAHSKHVVLWGRNAGVTNQHLIPFLKEAKTRGATLTIVNPLPTPLDRMADYVIRPKPGADGALALGLCRQLIADGRYDQKFVQTHVQGFAAFQDLIEAYDLARVISACGISLRDFDVLANLYAEKPTTTLLGIGLQRYRNGGNTIRAIDALCAITGQIGVPGGGANYANREMARFVNWDYLSGKRTIQRRVMSRTTQAEEILRAQPSVDVLFVSRTNLLRQVPNTQKMRQAISGIGTVIVVDMFMTETAHIADYVLPTTSIFEEEDAMVTTMWNPYATYANPVVDPPEGVKPDWKIFYELADVMKLNVESVDPQTAIQTAIGLTEDEFRAWQINGYRKFPIAPVAYYDRSFLTNSRKVELMSGEGVSRVHFSVDEPQTEYPFRLLTIHPVYRQNSQTEGSRLEREIPLLFISEGATQREKLEQLEMVTVETPVGCIQAQVKSIPSASRDDVLWLEVGQRGINEITSSHKADLGDSSAQYDVWCKIIKHGQSTDEKNHVN
ncbi:molybdopterin-dependent oxidoreductase [Ferroacidibacillus organovorans]|uniref:4Fe-4S Mo/W bis-MGD-type domain-containing protein n=1 Tax=Ferroacidibacillus organovorans TaxID=1765683 RepID=A0A1V4EVL6_9BACL|nr:molybdopterin-dependent oxidoreductase [Ferroacidibacillus organovorans]OPG16804.1 hypothetical protein B2M26_04700 [Ferroacidibacillus organovorans]